MQFSEQELVDCSDSYGNQGCNGGDVRLYLKYVQDKKGIATALTYPFVGAVSCRCTNIEEDKWIHSYM